MYVYKLTTDNNGAPCVQAGLLSCAICKPFIRTSAQVGDFLFGFAANSLDRTNPLIYVARITAIAEGGDYYAAPRYHNRPDCVYELIDGRYQLRVDARYHTKGDHLTTDLGEPPEYIRDRVLLSDDFRYLGDSGRVDLHRFPVAQRLVESLGRGHRVNHSREERDELLTLQKYVWRAVSSSAIGTPTQQLDTTRPHRPARRPAAGHC